MIKYPKYVYPLKPESFKKASLGDENCACMLGHVAIQFSKNPLCYVSTLRRVDIKIYNPKKGSLEAVVIKKLKRFIYLNSLLNSEEYRSYNNNQDTTFIHVWNDNKFRANTERAKIWNKFIESLGYTEDVEVSV